jgi:hypothetical protein
LRKEEKQKFEELTADIKAALGTKCELQGPTIELFLVVTLVAKDGFSEKHFFRMSASIRDIVDGAPNIKVEFSHCNEADYVNANNAKPSFEYDRYSAFTTDTGSKLLLGYATVGGGFVMKKFDPHFQQPTIAFLKGVKSPTKH